MEDDGRIQNLFEVHIVNKQSESRSFEIVPAEGTSLEYVIAMPTVDLKGGEGMRVPIFVYSKADDASDDIALVVRVHGGELRKALQAAFLRPRK